MFDRETLKTLIDFRDDQGVLSFYVGFTPEKAADPQPTAPIEIRNQVKELRRSLEDAEPGRRKAVEERLDELGDDVGGLLDPKAHGRGRALFVGVSDGRREQVSLQIPFRERVILHDTAYMRPLVAAVDEGRPAGILVAHAKGVRILEWSVGEAEEMLAREFELTDAMVADIKSGPSFDNPQNNQRGMVNRERFEDRIDENRNRFLKEAITETVQLAAGRDWDRIVVAGAPKIREEVRAALPDNGFRSIVADQTWEIEAPHEIARQAWPILRSVHRKRERELVETARDRALSGGAGALGLPDTLDAINQGRIQHLLFDNEVQAEGYASEQGTLHLETEGPGIPEGLELSEERLLVDRMAQKVLSMSGQVTPVEEEAAEVLAEYGGVGALLRW